MRLRNLPHRLARFFFAPLRWLLGIFHSRVHGDARWMSRWEKRRFLHPRHEGLVLSPNHRLSLEDSFANLALVAPTGAGKTSKYVIPNVLLCTGSVVVTDPAGEIFAKTSGHLHERGYRIQVLSPADLGRSLRFNPLEFWQTPQQLRQLATILARHGESGRADPFWTISAINVLSMVLSALVRSPDPMCMNLANIRWLLTNLDGGEQSGIHAFMSRHLDEQGFAEYRAFCATDPKLQGSILASARASVEPWADPNICAFTSDNTLDLRILRRRHTALYLIVPEHQVGYFSLLLNLIYSACFAVCLEPPSADALPVFFFLDEFGNLGRIENFAGIITTLRKRRCSISIILQEPSQLDAIYGKEEARTIFSGGCMSKLFLPGLDLVTTQYVEQALGRTTQYDTTFGGIDDHARTIGVPLLSADQVRMLEPDHGILLSGRERPVKIGMRPFFSDARMREMADKGVVEVRSEQEGEGVRYLSLG